MTEHTSYIDGGGGEGAEREGRKEGRGEGRGEGRREWREERIG